jgi:hypothetical protein
VAAAWVWCTKPKTATLYRRSENAAPERVSPTRPCGWPFDIRLIFTLGMYLCEHCAKKHGWLG